ncbi:YdaS family helix-turn-helix protein [uncultured Nitratireductor sp.]|uniref:transcriptional regulator n=1 Tax=uncultured Nitratireductor sp. TaxID=520953 RepID=UPI00263894CF|nr:YdaS family helix-turn-helix protein [uncultured Nitratireductor sp.]
MEQVCKNAIKKSGGPTVLAQRLAEAGVRISPQAISQWKAIPSGRAVLIEQISGISRHELRPDIFGPAPETAA